MPKLDTRPHIEPLLKWAGGKRQLLKHLLPVVPKRFHTYYEPFVGGGALLFALRPERAVLADKNPELTNCYSQVRDRPEEVIRVLERWPNSEAHYNQVRSHSPTCPTEKAARVIYLTRLSFNGIYRLNAKGEFNVPYGHRPHRPAYDPEQIREVSAALRQKVILTGDFAATVEGAQRGDLVYFDPPYAEPDDTSRFVRYNDKKFNWDDQVRLADVASELVARGVSVVVSNADHPQIRGLYRGFYCIAVERNSSMAADGNQRGPTTECIFHRNGNG